jgi:hypothetical protein
MVIKVRHAKTSPSHAVNRVASSSHAALEIAIDEEAAGYETFRPILILTRLYPYLL